MANNILDGASDELQRLWKLRDDAMEYERRNDLQPRTSNRFKKAQTEMDEYIIPSPKKAQRKKPKKKIYNTDSDWGY